MILQTVRGVKRGEIGHGAVAGNLGDDGGGGDGGAEGVAVDYCFFFTRETGFFVAVDEAEVGLLAETRDGAAHGEEAGLEDIVGVDFLDGGDADGPVDFGVSAEEVVDFFAMLFDEELRVVEMLVSQTVGDNGSGGVDGAGPAASADFIDAGDKGDALGAEGALEFPGEGGSALAGHAACNDFRGRCGNENLLF